jgi:hypothetical protein
MNVERKVKYVSNTLIQKVDKNNYILVVGANLGPTHECA